MGNRWQFWTWIFSETLLQGLRKYEVLPYRVYVIGTLDQSLSSSPRGARHFRCARSPGNEHSEVAAWEKDKATCQRDNNVDSWVNIQQKGESERWEINNNDYRFRMWWDRFQSPVFLFVESGILGLRIPKIQLKESGIPLTIRIIPAVPSSTGKDWNLVPGIWNPPRGIQNPRPS